MTESGTSRGWVFTIHDYTDEQLRRGNVWLETHDCIGISAGLEICPETKRKHIQGYVRLDRKVRKTAFQKIIGPNETGKTNWYVASACADWASNAKYTSKDGNVVWHKIPPVNHQGSRTELVEFRDAIKRGAPDRELFEDHLNTLAKFPRLENRLKESYAKEAAQAFRFVTVNVYWGAAGTGKTRKAIEAGAHKWGDFDDGWWCGYDGEKHLLIDDFYGGIKYSKLLTLLDGYPERLKVKGTHTYAFWTTVTITSNKHPSEWYERGLTPALARRITNIVEFK